MAGAVYDMHTDGPLVGQVKQPMRYTETQERSTIVQMWEDLATPLGSWAQNLLRGLNFQRMLDPEATDEERAALVRGVLERVDGRPRPGVASVDPVDVETDLGFAAGPRVVVTASGTLASGDSFQLGPFVVA